MLLTPRQKIVYRLYHRQGVPQKEIATRLHITPESVCRLLARAEDRVREMIIACPAGGACEVLEAYVA